MKIRFQSGGKDRTIRIPNFLLSPRSVLLLTKMIGKKAVPGSVDRIPPEVLDGLCRALRDIRCTYGVWELVEIESAEGDHVHILL